MIKYYLFNRPKLFLTVSVYFFLGMSTTVVGQFYKTATQNQLIQGYLDQVQPSYHRAQAVQYRLGDDMMDKETNIRRVYARQEYQGIEIREAMLSLHYAPNGKSTQTDEFVEVKVNTVQATLSADQAIRAAMLEMGGFPAIATLYVKKQQSDGEQMTIFDKGDIAGDDMVARLIFVENEFKKGNYLLAWETQLFTKDRQHYWLSYIDASSGKLLDYQDLVLHCSFGGEVTDASPEEQKRIDQEHQKLHLESAKRIEEYLAQQQDMINTIPLAESNFLTSSMAAPPHTYRVLNFPAEAPNDSSLDAMGNPINDQTLVTTAGDAIASPYGWNSLDGTNQLPETNGNNVYAFYDPSPGPLGGAPQPLTSAKPTTFSPLGSQTYDYAWDLTKEPEYTTLSATNQFPNRNAAIVNLFYWNNLVHDVFYGFGFTESGRNFQMQNSFPTQDIVDRGGVGNDHVLAQAQDAGGVNNANFLTLQDGVNGQMQMYLWTSAVVDHIVKIQTGSLAGMDYEAIQGAMYVDGIQNLPTNNLDLRSNPLENKELVLINTINNDEMMPCNDKGTTGCGTQQDGVGVGEISCNDIAGKIVLIDRGDCSFVEKVHGAQLSNAVGVIVMNNNTSNPNEIIAMGGSDATVNTITIPAVMVSYNTGVALKNAIKSGTITATLSLEAAVEPKKDGDFDNGIIAHEYGHGISSRTSPQTLTGGSLSGDEQGGEGWSDFWALYMTTSSQDLIMGDPNHPNGRLPDRGIGSYIRYTDDSGPGIRPRKYSVDMNINEFTYAKPDDNTDVAGSVAPHGVGFVWCTMLYELEQNFIDEYGFNNDIYNNGLNAQSKGNNIVNRLIIEGIRHQGAGPTFVSQRDGILEADQLLYNGDHQCLIWDAFARRGLGVFAKAGSNGLGDETESFDIPGECGSDAAFINIELAVPTLTNNNNIVNYVLTVSNLTNITANNVAVELDIPEGFSYVTSTNEGAEVGNKVSWTIPIIAGLETKTIIATLHIATPTQTNILFRDEMESPSNWTPSISPLVDDAWRLTQLEPYSGNNVWFVPDPDNLSEQTLTMDASPVARNDEKLVFVHKYATEKGYDVGVVKASINGGLYTKLNTFEQNGYNDEVELGDNPLITGGAFGGGSEGYIFSIADLPVEAGQSVSIQFEFAADALTPSTGWWVDDVMLCTSPTIINTDARAMVEGGTEQVTSATTIVTADILAIELLELNANPLDEDIRLDWTTTMESEHQGFGIERRTEDETDFAQIAWVKGNGTTQNISKYDYLDKNVKANITYYYRLRQEDIHGKVTYSSIRSARIDRAETGVALVPNPSNGLVHVEWEEVLDKHYEVQVIGVNGQILMRKLMAAGSQSLRLDLSDFPSHIYVVKMISDDRVITRKLILN